MKRRLHLLVLPPVIASTRWTGGRNRSLEVYSALRRFRVTLVVLIANASATEELVRAPIARAENAIVFRRYQTFRERVFLLVQGVRAVKSADALVCTSNLPLTVFLSWIIARVIRRPLILTVQLVDDEFCSLMAKPSSNLSSHLFRSAFEDSVGVITIQNPFSERILRSLLPSTKLLTVSNGVRVSGDVTRVRQPKNLDAIFLGQLTARKGIWFLPEIWEAVTRRFPSARLCIAGHGDDETINHLKRELSVRKLSDAVRITGWVEEQEKWDLLRRAKLFVFPSTNESFGSSIAEALAVGTPACVWDIPQLSHFESGVAKARFPDTAEFGRQVCVLLADEQARNRLGIEGFDFAKTRLDWNAAVDSEERALSELLGSELDSGQA